MLYQVLTIVAAFSGFLVAFYIGQKKQREQPLVCPLHADCDTVVHSEFSFFFGIPLEYLGMLYYALVAASYLVFLALPSLATSLIVFLLLVLSTAAFLFSLYLTFIQAFYLKQWCSWCLVSAALSTCIFFLTLLGSNLYFIPLLAENRTILLIIHTLGFIVGLGGATITDVFFFKFIRDLRISHGEAAILRTLSQIIWAGLAVLVISGAGLYFPEASRLLVSGKFLLKMVVVAVIIVNGAFLNLLISPKLIRISFGQQDRPLSPALLRTRKLAFALGSISFTSWYSAFILGILRNVPFGFWTLLGLYVTALAVAITGSQILERLISRRASIDGP